MKLHVNSSCVGCALCTSICPELFVMTEMGVAAVRDHPIPPDKEDMAQNAAESCPAAAIEIH